MTNYVLCLLQYTLLGWQCDQVTRPLGPSQSENRTLPFAVKHSAIDIVEQIFHRLNMFLPASKCHAFAHDWAIVLSRTDFSEDVFLASFYLIGHLSGKSKGQ